MVMKEVQITGVIRGHVAGGLHIVVGRARTTPASNALHASDLKLKTIHTFQVTNHNSTSGTIINAKVFPIPSVAAAYGSLPTRDNYASLYVSGIGTAGPVVVATSGTFGYNFIAIGE